MTFRDALTGLPRRTGRDVRFDFEIEPDYAAWDALPKRVRLTWRSAPGAAATAPGAGQRFEVTARLKRPHGKANSYTYDSEAALFADGIRATGYVLRARPLPVPRGLMPRLARLVALWRARVAARLAEVLGDAPQAGAVAALIIGVQDGLGQADWERLRRTGTTHLMAISGLHLGLVAAGVGWPVAWLWRQTSQLGASLPLRCPAPWAGLGAAFAAATCYAALAGFGVPVRRAWCMLGVAALARFSGRTSCASHALAWALALVTAFDPWAVLAAGFWLSFAAVALIFLSRDAAPRAAAGWSPPPAPVARASRASSLSPGVPLSMNPSTAPRLAAGVPDSLGPRAYSGP